MRKRERRRGGSRERNASPVPSLARRSTAGISLTAAAGRLARTGLLGGENHSLRGVARKLGGLQVENDNHCVEFAVVGKAPPSVSLTDTSGIWHKQQTRAQLLSEKRRAYTLKRDSTLCQATQRQDGKEHGHQRWHREVRTGAALELVLRDKLAQAGDDLANLPGADLDLRRRKDERG